MSATETASILRAHQFKKSTRVADVTMFVCKSGCEFPVAGGPYSDEEAEHQAAVLAEKQGETR